eukprot:TRINITY_DN29389_c0_g1_i1.p1 TRINITY_DN29389_c0_g1~~TRINITY_DN29389_c0_g1_i1.p1  ORF type:complete len:617 (+),score=122.33 TRINITY_DN29389_c0_g1_i1:85-1935(+)
MSRFIPSESNAAYWDDNRRHGRARWVRKDGDFDPADVDDANEASGGADRHLSHSAAELDHSYKRPGYLSTYDRWSDGGRWHDERQWSGSSWNWSAASSYDVPTYSSPWTGSGKASSSSSRGAKGSKGKGTSWQQGAESSRKWMPVSSTQSRSDSSTSQPWWLFFLRWSAEFCTSKDLAEGDAIMAENTSGDWLRGKVVQTSDDGSVEVAWDEPANAELPEQKKQGEFVKPIEEQEVVKLLREAWYGRSDDSYIFDLARQNHWTCRRDKGGATQEFAIEFNLEGQLLFWGEKQAYCLLLHELQSVPSKAVWYNSYSGNTAFVWRREKRSEAHAEDGDLDTVDPAESSTKDDPRVMPQDWALATEVEEDDAEPERVARPRQEVVPQHHKAKPRGPPPKAYYGGQLASTQTNVSVHHGMRYVPPWQPPPPPLPHAAAATYQHSGYMQIASAEILHQQEEKDSWEESLQRLLERQRKAKAQSGEPHDEAKPQKVESKPTKPKSLEEKAAEVLLSSPGPTSRGKKIQKSSTSRRKDGGREKEPDETTSRSEREGKPPVEDAEVPRLDSKSAGNHLNDAAPSMASNKAASPSRTRNPQFYLMAGGVAVLWLLLDSLFKRLLY